VQSRAPEGGYLPPVHARQAGVRPALEDVLMAGCRTRCHDDRPFAIGMRSWQRQEVTTLSSAPPAPPDGPSWPSWHAKAIACGRSAAEPLSHSPKASRRSRPTSCELTRFGRPAGMRRSSITRRTYHTRNGSRPCRR
jgi:hypothetical protein